MLYYKFGRELYGTSDSTYNLDLGKRENPGKKMVKLKNYLILSPNMRKVDYFVLETRC